MKFCLQVGHSTNLKHSKSNRPVKATKSLQWKLQARGQELSRTIDLLQLSFDIGRSRTEPTNYEKCLYLSD